MQDKSGITGRVEWQLHDRDGHLLSSGHTTNLVTAVGDQYYAGRAVLSSGLPAQATGMHLGTGGTTPSKTGGGAAITTYLAGSNKAFDSGFPTAAAGIVTWKRTYGVGEATSGVPLTEVAVVTKTIATDSAATAAETIARALISPGTKGASDILTITWTHTLLGG